MKMQIFFLFIYICSMYLCLSFSFLVLFVLFSLFFSFSHYLRFVSYVTRRRDMYLCAYINWFLFSLDVSFFLTSIKKDYEMKFTYDKISLK